MNQKKFYIVMFALCTACSSACGSQTTDFTFVDTDSQKSPEHYQYSVIQAGDNYNFKFDKSPADNSSKLKAGYHVLQSVYKDDSIYKTHSESYIRERARCYVFDSSFHTYSLCFLPNDFSLKDKGRFWGFVTQMPNWKWLVTRFFLPLLLIYALVFYTARRKKANVTEF